MQDLRLDLEVSGPGMFLRFPLISATGIKTSGSGPYDTACLERKAIGPMTEEEHLTTEEALTLLDEFQGLLPALESGETEGEVAEQARLLVSGLWRLPLPANILEDHVREIEGWTNALLEMDDEEAESGVGSIPTFLDERLYRLRMMVDSALGR